MPHDVVYEPYTAYGEPGNPTWWVWDCRNCYESEQPIATEDQARERATQHAKLHGARVRKG